jgi:hypothetical protein
LLLPGTLDGMETLVKQDKRPPQITRISPGRMETEGLGAGKGFRAAIRELIDENANPASALVGLAWLIRRFGTLFRDAGDDQFTGLETAFRGHGGQFVTQ